MFPGAEEPRFLLFSHVRDDYKGDKTRWTMTHCPVEGNCKLTMLKYLHTSHSC